MCRVERTDWIHQKNQILKTDLLPRKPPWEAHGKQRRGFPAALVGPRSVVCTRTRREEMRRIASPTAEVLEPGNALSPLPPPWSVGISFSAADNIPVAR